VLRYWVVAGLGFIVGCGSAGGASPAEGTEGAIVGGQIDEGDPAVVALLDGSGKMKCTGTLIAPSAILTAGHCSGGSLKTAVFGPKSSSERRVAIAETRRHPQYAGEGKGYDVGVLLLATAVDGVAPVPLASAPLGADAVGSTVRHVGFGDTKEGLFGITSGRGDKHQVSYPITAVEELLIWSGAPDQQTCNGDSGGPALVTVDGVEQVVAVVSDGPNCHDAGNDARVDVPVISAWISAQIAPSNE
jgi:secreted trypsin-like serine protease